MKIFIFAVLSLVSTVAFSQAKNFEGFGISVDYSLNAITDKSTPGTSDTSNSGIPSITADFNKAITDRILIGAYLSYDLVTTDTAGSDPNAQHPVELGGKVAYAFTDSLMGYVKLGYAWSRYSSPGFYQVLRGPAYGVGAEYKLTKNIFTRLEIARQNYQNIVWSDGSADKVNIDSYGISIGYRF
jgi:opacity protein-like surface antigen